MTFSGFSKHLGNDHAKSGCSHGCGGRREWWKVLLTITSSGRQKRGSDVPPVGSVLGMPLFSTAWKKRKARGNLVIVPGCGEPSLTRLGQPGFFWVKVLGIRGHRQGGKERGREKSVCGFLKKKKEKILLFFPVWEKLFKLAPNIFKKHILRVT